MERLRKMVNSFKYSVPEKDNEFNEVSSTLSKLGYRIDNLSTIDDESNGEPDLEYILNNQKIGIEYTEYVDDKIIKENQECGEWNTFVNRAEPILQEEFPEFTSYCISIVFGNQKLPKKSYYSKAIKYILGYLKQNYNKQDYYILDSNDLIEKCVSEALTEEEKYVFENIQRITLRKSRMNLLRDELHLKIYWWKSPDMEHSCFYADTIDYSKLKDIIIKKSNKKLEQKKNYNQMWLAISQETIDTKNIDLSFVADISENIFDKILFKGSVDSDVLVYDK